MKIYTRTGDRGETSLFSGDRVSKGDQVIEALGTVDECNSTIGVALSLLPQDDTLEYLRSQLEMIQHALFDLGAAIATPRTQSSSFKLEKTRFNEEATESLEKWIDEMDGYLPPLKAFILPGGHPAGAMLHLSRTICRRAERDVIAIHEREDISDEVLVYLNRLSDYLFVASRYVNMLLETPEITWEMHKKLTNV